MAAEAIIGGTHVFQVIFVDASNLPVVVTNPTISVFYYDAVGTKQWVVNGAAMTLDPTEVGRYVYPQLIATTFNDGDTIYGKMTATNPGTGDEALAEQTVNLVSASRAHGGTVVLGGLRATFVKGG